MGSSRSHTHDTPTSGNVHAIVQRYRKDITSIRVQCGHTAILTKQPTSCLARHCRVLQQSSPTNTCFNKVAQNSMWCRTGGASAGLRRLSVCRPTPHHCKQWLQQPAAAHNQQQIHLSSWRPSWPPRATTCTRWFEKVVRSAAQWQC